MTSNSHVKNFRFLILIYLFHFIRYGMVLPIIPLFAQELVTDPAKIGLVVSCFNLLAMFLAIPIGGIIDRLGMKKVLLFGVASNMIHSFMLASAPNLFYLIFAQLFGGVGFLFIIVSCQTYVSHLPKIYLRERGFGFLAFISAIGFIVGPPLGGILSVHLSYRIAFILSGMLASIGTVVFFIDKNIDSEYSIQKDGTRIFTKLRSMINNTSLISILVVAFTITFVVNLRDSFLPVLLKYKHFDEMTIGVLYGIFALAMIAVRVLIGRVMGMVSRKSLLWATLLLLAVGHGALPMLTSPSWLGTVLFFGGLGFGISQPLTMVMVSDFSGSGLAMGVRFTAITAATVFSPLIMGWIVNIAGLEFPFYFGALMILSLPFFISNSAFSNQVPDHSSSH